MEREEDALSLKKEFPSMKRVAETRLVFSEESQSVADVLRFVADGQISLVKLERREISLEDLFMGVTEA